MDFHKIYKPITAAPFINDKSHVEIEPCNALKPYIRCFWGSEYPYMEDMADEMVRKLVVPDTCMDVIFRINYTENKLESTFCGINDAPLFSDGQGVTRIKKSVFGIRFYAWGVTLFSEDSMQNVKNGFFDAGQYFSKLTRELEHRLFDLVELKQRVAIAQEVLLQQLNLNHSNPLVMEAIEEIHRKRGNLKFLELSNEMHISKRQMERLFKEYIGISPKMFSSLIRYQYLWNDVFWNRDFQIQDSIYQYGYTDQSHLIHNFKRFHSMNPTQAKEYAFSNVAFLQEK